MKKYATIIFSAILLLALSVVPAMAQAQQGQEDQARAEYDAFMKVYNFANQDKNPDKTLEAAKDYLAKYPSGQYADRAKQAVTWAQGMLFQRALDAKDFDKVFAIGNEILTGDPNNIGLRYQLVFVGNQMFDQNKWDNQSEIANEIDKVEQLANSGPKPATMTDAQWNTQKPLMLGYLYQTRGRMATHAGKTDDAIGFYKKSSELDPSTPYSLYLMGGVYGQKYQEAKDAYDKLTDEQKGGDAGTAALDNLNKAADAVIDTYAKFIAVSEGKQGYEKMRSTAQSTLVALYTFRHKDKPDGWQDLVNQYKGKPGQ